MARVLEDVAGGLEELAGLVVGRLRASIPSYAALAPEELLPGVRTSLAAGLRAVAERRLLTETEAEGVDAVVEARAHQGLPLEAVLAAYRIGTRCAWERVVDLARTRELDAAVVLEAAQRAWDWADAVTERAALAHRRAELALARHEQLKRASFLRAVLSGGVSPEEAASLGVLHGLDPATPYLTLRARPARDKDLYELEQALLAQVAGPALLGIVDGDLAGLVEDAPSLSGFPAAVGLGPAVDLGSASRSFSVASRVLRAAVGFGLTGVFRLGDLALLVAVADDVAVGEALVARHLAPLRALNNDARRAVLFETVRAYLSAGCSVERAARALYAHPNTVRYRLGQLEALTGVGFARLEDLFGWWWALERERFEGTVPRAGGGHSDTGAL